MNKRDMLRDNLAEQQRIIDRIEASFETDVRNTCPHCLEKAWCYRGHVPTGCKCRECELSDLQDMLRNPANELPNRRERCLMAKANGGVKPCEALVLGYEQKDKGTGLNDISV